MIGHRSLRSEQAGCVPLGCCWLFCFVWVGWLGVGLAGFGPLVACHCASALSLHCDRDNVATAMSCPIGPILLPAPLLLTRGAVAGWPWCFGFAGVGRCLVCCVCCWVLVFFLATLHALGAPLDMWRSVSTVGLRSLVAVRLARCTLLPLCVSTHGQYVHAY